MWLPHSPYLTTVFLLPLNRRCMILRSPVRSCSLSYPYLPCVQQCCRYNPMHRLFFYRAPVLCSMVLRLDQAKQLSGVSLFKYHPSLFQINNPIHISCPIYPQQCRVWAIFIHYLNNVEVRLGTRAINIYCESLQPSHG